MFTEPPNLRGGGGFSYVAANLVGYEDVNQFSFKLEKCEKSGGARAGVLHTPHGDVPTPVFSPVGTRGSVKGVLPEQLRALGTQIVLANTYHLFLKPGEDVVQSAGGVASFMNWHGPTITDSGGFQVFSLGAAFGKKLSKFVSESQEFSDQNGLVEVEPTRESFGKETAAPKAAPAVYDEELATQHGQLAIIDDEGVTFTSHIDGSLHRFTPERSVEIQHALAADIFFAFDECTAPTEPFEYQREAMYRTHRWAERSLKAHRQNIEASRTQMIFGIAQGGQFDELRRESAKTIGEMGFDGFGLGGSFSKKYGENSLESALAMLREIPPELPVHGLGVGEPGDVLLSIAHGVDVFDCVAPTRLGRHGTIYTRRGPISLANDKYKYDFMPFDPETLVPGTEGFTRAYVSHLLRNGEMLGSVLCSIHNLGFILQLVAGARVAIYDGQFDTYRETFVRDYYK